MLLVAGVLLPVVVFSVFIVERLAASQRAAAERRLVLAAHDLTASLERELAGTIRALNSLANSDELERGDIPGFRAEALRAIASQPSWHHIILRHADGRALVNTRLPAEAELPTAVDGESIRKAIETRRPVIGNLVVGNDKVLSFGIRVPVIFGDEVRYVLTAAIQPAAVAGLVAGRRDPEDEWSRGIVDSRGVVVARTRDPEKYVGQPGNPTYLAGIREADEGFFRSTTLDGQAAYSAFRRSSLSGWTSGVAVPADAIDGPVRRSVMTVSAAGLAMLILSAAGAVFFSRKVSRGIADAAVAADSLARGERPPERVSPVTELARLNDSLRRSADLLASREQERDAHLARADAARAEAEAGSRAKDEFLAMLGHELRNPLAPIRTGVHLLATLPPGDERADSVRQTIERQVAHMTSLVDDLLDASRVARGKVELDPRPLDLRAIVRDVTTDLRPEFEQANVSLAADLPDSPVPVVGDSTRLAQCLGNLLHNALKFTPPAGRVRVSLSADSSHATLAVHDTGVGIPADLLPRLFQPFAQGPQSPARPHGGLGLGLALVRGFITLHNGTVTGYSDGSGKGATFTLTLPIHAGGERIAAPDLPQHATGNVPQAAPAPRRILIVEDLRDAARTLKLLLSIDGHDVRTAATAADALAAVPDFSPDVVVCDIGLPDMDGYDLCRHLRRHPSVRSARLIALTGYGQAEDVARATAAGFDLHLTKPVDIPTLRQAVSAVPAAVE